MKTMIEGNAIATRFKCFRESERERERESARERERERGWS